MTDEQIKKQTEAIHQATKNALKSKEAARRFLEDAGIIEKVDYKAKYEKCIDVIKRFDPGIIGMYDL